MLQKPKSLNASNTAASDSVSSAADCSVATSRKRIRGAEGPSAGRECRDDESQTGDPHGTTGFDAAKIVSDIGRAIASSVQNATLVTILNTNTVERGRVEVS